MGGYLGSGKQSMPPPVSSQQSRPRARFVQGIRGGRWLTLSTGDNMITTRSGTFADPRPGSSPVVPNPCLDEYSLPAGVARLRFLSLLCVQAVPSITSASLSFQLTEELRLAPPLKLSQRRAENIPIGYFILEFPLGSHVSLDLPVGWGQMKRHCVHLWNVRLCTNNSLVAHRLSI